MKNRMNGLKQFFNTCFFGFSLLLFGAGCTKNNDIQCLDCDEVFFDEVPILLQSSPEPDTTKVIIDDTLIL